MNKFEAEYPVYKEALALLFKYTVGIKGNVKSSDDEIGAGVLLEISGRKFVLTAAHCLRPDPVVFGDELSLPQQKARFPILNVIIHPDYSEYPLANDIGVAELGGIDVGFLSLSLPQLCFDPVVKDQSYWVVGFPLNCRSVTQQHVLIPKAIFHALFSHEEDGRLYFDYPPDDAWMFPENVGGLKPFSTPKGFSGGGLWGITGGKEGSLFAPERNIKIWGIQSSWRPNSRKVAYYPIKQWLDLIYGAYPQLTGSA